MPHLCLDHNKVGLGQLKLKTKVIGLPKLGLKGNWEGYPTKIQVAVGNKDRVALMFTVLSPDSTLG